MRQADFTNERLLFFCLALKPAKPGVGNGIPITAEEQSSKAAFQKMACPQATNRFMILTNTRQTHPSLFGHGQGDDWNPFLKKRVKLIHAFMQQDESIPDIRSCRIGRIVERIQQPTLFPAIGRHPLVQMPPIPLHAKQNTDLLARLTCAGGIKIRFFLRRIHVLQCRLVSRIL